MYAAAMALLSCGLLTADVPPPEEPTLVDLSILQGSWRLVHQRTGSGAEEDVRDDLRWAIRGGEIVQTWDGNETCRGTFCLSPAKSAFRVDCVWGGNTTHENALIRVIDDRLEFVVEEEGPPSLNGAPTKSNTVVLTFRRIAK
ncbi:MAG TPA: hypothetical protein VMS17_26205 [Gemmataceae bacterium]|nr:hypothetical protein [Gemmataceae bacterium]